MSRGRRGGLGRFVYEGSWAGRPAAGAVPVGSWIRITSGFGATGRTGVFETDGTYWRPLNGRVSLAAMGLPRSTPLASAIGNGAQQLFTLPSNILVPAGMMFPGARICAAAVFQRTVAGGPSSVNMPISIAGTPNLLTGASPINTAGVSNIAGQIVHVVGAATCVSATQYMIHNYMPYNGQTQSANSGESSNSNPSLDHYVRAGMGAEATAADTFALLSLTAWIEG